MLLAAPVFAQCTGGTSGTADGGKVTYTCAAATIAANCVTGATLPGQYSTQTYSALPTEPKRCMIYEMNTADGLTNTNDTLIGPRQGAGMHPFGTGSLDWTGGFGFSNGTQPRFDYSVVDGTDGKHYNIIMPQYTLAGHGQFAAAINASTCSFTINGSGADYWPQSATYVLNTQGGELID
jgi:hypothetical protein